MKKTTLLIFLATTATSVAAQTTERRCGWIDNPTPANWWIEDSDSSWLLSRQGDSSLSRNGFQDLPKEAFHFGDEWVYDNDINSYGYGCGCIEAVFVDDIAVSVASMEPLPLARCEMDQALERR